MHRSSKQRRQQLAGRPLIETLRSPLSKTLRWKRALLAAACAASCVTGSLVFGQESTPARKKLPTRPVTPVAQTREAAGEALAPLLRTEESSGSAAAKSPSTKLLGAGRGVFRPVAIEAIPAEPKLEVKARPIPTKRVPAPSQPEETLAPIVSASSLPRFDTKGMEQKPAKEGAGQEFAAAPLSPWMQDIRASQPEFQPVEKDTAAPQEATPPEVVATPATPTAPAKLPAKLTIFERAAMPALPEAEAAEVRVVELQVIEAQEPAPIVPAPKAKPPVREVPEPKLLVLPSQPVRARPPVQVQAKAEPKVEPKAPAKAEAKVAAKAESLVIAVQNEAAQPKAEAPPGPDKDADLKKHFEVIQQTGEFTVQVHRSKLLRTAKDIYRTAVVDDGVLEIVQFTPREISLIGRSQGATHVTFWFDDPATQPVTYLVKVEPDAGQVKIDEEKYQLLEDMINEMFPDSKIHLQLIANKLVVRGQARDSEEAFQIMTLIRAQGIGYGGGGGGLGGGYGLAGINQGEAANPLADSATGAARRTQYQVINMLRVPGVQQVALRVKIAELNRSAARNFGMNVQGHIDVGDSSKILLNSILGTGGKTAPAILANFDGDDISVGLSTLSQHGVIKLLSEPTLVTLSGNPATFIAGGEFAVPTVVGTAGLNAVTTDFRAFGAIISFLPTVVDKDRIRLQVAPEFSQINSDLTVNGTPGLKVRAATTTVEMREGQTLAIAGLLEDSINANSAGDIPFLSKWIGKRGVTRAETELIILVTPELVHPMEPEEVPPLPGFDVTEPTNKQFYFHGDIEGNPTMDYRSTVWPRLKNRYKAGGPAMTSGPFGHGQ